jgi:hypothetical protein
MAARSDAPTASSTPRLKATTAVGDRRATLSVSARARASPGLERGARLFDEPDPHRLLRVERLAGHAETQRLVHTHDRPELGRSPGPGTIPSPVSGSPNCAPGAAIR